MSEPSGTGDTQDRRHLGELASAGAPAPDPPRRVRVATLAALALLAGLLALRWLDVDPVARLRLLGFDLMQRLVPVPAPAGPPQVVVVAIDDASLAGLGQWPWPRDLLASVVGALDRQQVSVIAFDILFPEPDRGGAGAGPGPDAALAAAIAASRAPVVLASALQRVGTEAAADRPILPPTLALEGPSPLAWLPGADGVMGNIAALEEVAAGRGFLTTISDGDGVLRRLPLLAHVGPNLQGGLVLEVVRTALGAEVATVRSHALFGVEGIAVGDAVIATDETGALWLGAGSAPAPVVSVADLLAGVVDGDVLAGRIAVVGATAAGLGDRATTTRGSMRSGVEILAAGIEGALSAETPARPGAMRWLEMLAVLLIGLALIYRMSLYTAVRTAIWAGITISVTAGIAVVLLAFGGILADPSFPILSTAAVAAFVGYARSREVERGRALARQSLAETASFIHRLVDATFDSVIAVDRDGRLLFANRAARTLPIFATAPALGADVLALLRRADDAGLASRPSAAELAAAEGSVDLVAVTPAAAEPILLEATATALKDEPSGAVVLVMRDVTARRAAQRRIEDQARALEEMAADLKRQTDVAVAARTAADNANAAKGEFLMMMSHELRTPLNAVMGFAELMAAEPFGALGDRRYIDYLKDIRSSGAQLLGMIDSILEVIRLDRHDTDTHDGAFALVPVIEECCAALQPEAVMKSVELSSGGAGDLVFRGDVALMRHVLVSLLSNAIKFTGVGGRVSVTAAVAGDGSITIAVADTGIGMSQAELDRAVLMLEHSGSTMTRSHGGAGVGLALAKLATEKQGGQLRLSSVVGRGTTVEAWFPQARLLRPAAAVADIGHRDPGGASLLRRAGLWQ